MPFTAPSSWRLDGRLCLLTGATSGIGREAAIQLAGAGADLILVGRSASRLARVEKGVRRARESRSRESRASTAGRPAVRSLVADFSSLQDVRNLASQVAAEEQALHVLINNAAVVTPSREESRDGYEMQLAVNHLAPFLLTNLLLPLLEAGAPSRVVTVASQVERDGVIDFDDFQSRNSYESYRAYRQSKLANILFTGELARRVSGRGITAVSLHPGVYATKLVDALYGWSRIVTVLRGRGLPDPSEGGSVLLHAAADPELAGRPGAHLHEHELRDPTKQARDPVLAARLWAESARLVGLTP